MKPPKHIWLVQVGNLWGDDWYERKSWANGGKPFRYRLDEPVEVENRGGRSWLYCACNWRVEEFQKYCIHCGSRLKWK